MLRSQRIPERDDRSQAGVSEGSLKASSSTKGSSQSYLRNVRRSGTHHTWHYGITVRSKKRQHEEERRSLLSASHLVQKERGCNQVGREGWDHLMPLTACGSCAQGEEDSGKSSFVYWAGQAPSSCDSCGMLGHRRGRLGGQRVQPCIHYRWRSTWFSKIWFIENKQLA